MKRTLTTTAALAALAWLISSTTASAQDAAVTAEIEELERMVDGSYWLGESTVVILRQASQQRMSAELEAFADRLAAMAADASLPEHVRTMPGSMILRSGDTIWAVDGSGSLAVWDPPPECVRGSRMFHKTMRCEAGYILY